ncbi:MAG: primosomal protein N' [Planctomycetes bacterium]|nr:primosomal protein N' [Planctomycetota bacterium]MBL7143356.1 primosomal protein N' [Phycisphaerae bacterium]
MIKYRTNSLFAIEDAEEEISCSHIIRVAFESAANAEFDYFVPDEIWPVEVGQRVEVPFGRKNKYEAGFCTQSDVRSEESFIADGVGRKLKRVTRLIDKEPLLNSELMELARWISDYYVCPLGQVLAAMVPSAVKRGAGVKTQKYVYLRAGSADIEKSIKELRGKKQKQIVKFLDDKRASSVNDAVEVRSLLEAVGCGNEPIKRLAEKDIVKIARKTILKSLPVIPKGMSIKTEQVVLNDDQRNALAHFEKVIDSGEFGVTLLYGVTDSGKTELYMRAIEAVLLKGVGAIVLLPEIALTAQTVQRFNERFKKIAVMHSGLSAAQRNVQWQKIKSGQANVVIGARSAVFAPLPKLGLVVVDEEHEPSYKQDTVPRYNGRDVAIKRAQLANAHCILGSATPSLETLYNCQSKKYFSLVHLPKRVMDLSMPEMKLVDLRQGQITQKGINLISEPLAKCLKETLAKKEQVILLLNRRGYSNFIFCPSCKHTLHCRNCDVTLTFHKSKAGRHERMKTVTGKHINYGYAVCHYCLAQTLVPEKCPLCGKLMAMIGLGSQRLEEELANKFPSARVLRIDSDSMASRDYYRLLRDFGEGRIDILAGTQMLAKGLHFPNVTLVGIISADTSLYLPDFRANERTFQLISQVAGRAGRSEKKGVVFVQTFLPNQPAIQFAVGRDFDGFFKEELKHRKGCNLPPFWRLAIIVMRDGNFDKLGIACKQMRQRIDMIIGREKLEANVRGPIPAVISRIQRFHRMQIIIQAPRAVTFQKLFACLRAAGPIRPAVKVAIDIDPVNLL